MKRCRRNSIGKSQTKTVDAGKLKYKENVLDISSNLVEGESGQSQCGGPRRFSGARTDYSSDRRLLPGLPLAPCTLR